MKSFLFLLFIFNFSEAAIFGVDDRVSIRQGSAGYLLSQSTAVAVLSGNIEKNNDGSINLLTESLKDYLCPNTRFSAQPSLSYACSGFLVAPDLIVTAGHCMVNTGETKNNSEDYCKVFSWLFDYYENINTTKVNTDNLYSCKEVIYAAKDEKAPYRDYALVRLNRPVLNRQPLKLNSAALAANEKLSMIGYPMGFPAKLSQNAKIFLNDLNRDSFLTSLDAFSGNSGSVVFNSKNEVVGILVGGTPSQDTLTKNSCETYNQCSDDGKNCLFPDADTSKFPGYQVLGTEVQRIAPVIKLINENK